MLPLLTTTAAHIDINAWLGNFNWSQPSWDMIVMMFLLFGGLLYGMSLGRDRLVLTTIAIYMALAIVDAAPFVNQTLAARVNFAGYDVDIKVVAFLGLLVVLLFVLSRGALFRSLLGTPGGGSFIQSTILSFAHSGLIVAVVMSYLPAAAVDRFSPFIRQSFVGDWQLFWWLLAPVVIMLLFTRRKV